MGKPKILEEQLERLAQLHTNHPALPKNVKISYGAIYAMYEWNLRDVSRPPDHPDEMLTALKQMAGGEQVTAAAFRGFYRNDAAFRLIACYERVHFLVDLPAATANPRKWRASWKEGDDPKALWEKHRVGKLPDALGRVREAVNPMKHWPVSEQEERITWDTALAALDELVAYMEAHAERIVIGKALFEQQHTARVTIGLMTSTKTSD